MIKDDLYHDYNIIKDTDKKKINKIPITNYNTIVSKENTNFSKISSSQIY